MMKRKNILYESKATGPSVLYLYKGGHDRQTCNRLSNAMFNF